MLLAPGTGVAGPNADPALHLQVLDCNSAAWSNTSIVFVHYRNGVVIETISNLLTDGQGFVDVRPGLAPKTEDVCRVAFSPFEVDGVRAREFVYRFGAPVEDYSWHPSPDPLEPCISGDCCTTGFTGGQFYIWQIRIPR
jgi:hypothetical protein